MLRLFPTGMIECDSPEEMVVVLSSRSGDGTAPASNGNGHSNDEPPAKRRRKRRSRRTSGEKDMEIAMSNSAHGAAKSWAAAKKEAKKQGRNDIAAVRSELARANKA